MLYRFKIFEKFDDVVRHGLSMRDGGVSKGPFESLNLGLKVDDDKKNVRENYRIFAEKVGFDLDLLCLAYQQHTDKVLVIRKEDLDDGSIEIGLENPFNAIDGFITDVPGVTLMVRFADCQGVLVLDPVKRVVSAVHSGWRGNAKNIIGKAVMKMVNEFECNPSDLLVGISPSLGPCCAEFTDPLKELPEFMHKYVDGQHVNLWQCSLDQLDEVGVPFHNIEIARKCTVCKNNEFFSYRGGNKTTGHMGGVIQLI